MPSTAAACRTEVEGRSIREITDRLKLKGGETCFAKLRKAAHKESTLPSGILLSSKFVEAAIKEQREDDLAGQEGDRDCDERGEDRHPGRFHTPQT